MEEIAVPAAARPGCLNPRWSSLILCGIHRLRGDQRTWRRNRRRVSGTVGRGWSRKCILGSWHCMRRIFRGRHDLTLSYQRCPGQATLETCVRTTPTLGPSPLRLPLFVYFSGKHRRLPALCSLFSGFVHGRPLCKSRYLPGQHYSISISWALSCNLITLSTQLNCLGWSSRASLACHFSSLSVHVRSLIKLKPSRK